MNEPDQAPAVAGDSKTRTHIPDVPQIHSPVVYYDRENGKQTVFAFSTITGGLPQVFSFWLTEMGIARGFRKLGDLPFEIRGRTFSSCVFKGRVYVFGDENDGNGRYRVVYKLSTDIGQGTWEPAERGSSYSTGLEGGYDGWVLRGDAACLRAVVFAGKIHVFAYRDHELHLATYDGNPEGTWVQHGPVLLAGNPVRIAPHFSLKVVTRCPPGESAPHSAIVLALVPDGTREVVLHYLREGRSVSEGRRIALAEGAVQDDEFSLAHGTVKGGAQADALQLFFNTGDGNRSGGANHTLRRAEVLHEASGVPPTFTDTDLWNFRYIGGLASVQPVNRCDAIEVTSEDVRNPGNFWRFIVVLTSDMVGRKTDLTVSAYRSDYFETVHESGPIDMGHHGGREELATWTLVGVVEGVPPFSRNGRTDLDETSVVKYGQTTGRQVKIDETYETSVGFKAGAAKIVGVEAELRASFAVSNVLTKTIRKKTEWTWRNTVRGNESGEWGWFLWSVPTVEGRTYRRKSHNQAVEIGPPIYVTRVTNVRLVARKARLDEMGRSPSTDLAGWAEAFPDYPNVEAVLTGGTLNVEDDERWAEQTLEVGEATMRSTSGTVHATVKAKATAKDLFGINAEAGMSYSSAVEIASEIDDHIEARLFLPKAAEGHPDPVTVLEVQPAWLIPREGAQMRPGNRPRWVPDDYRQTTILPWCLTWQVLR